MTIYSEFETKPRAPIWKAKRRDAGQAHIEVRAKALTRAITQWLQRIGDQELALALEQLPGKVRAAESRIAKASRADAKAAADLVALLSKYGLAQAKDAAERVARDGRIGRQAATDAVKVIAPGVLRDYLESKTVLLQGLPAQTRAAVRESVRRIIDAALREDPRPSTGDLARRIKNQFHGAAGEGGQPQALEITSLPTGITEVYSTDRGTMFAISSERAAAIARTELAQIENTATYATADSLGATELEWIAVTSDRRSGEREHWKMNHVRVKMGEKFKLPSGEKLRYPGDPEAPISESVNCRCSFRAVAFKED